MRPLFASIFHTVEEHLDGTLRPYLIGVSAFLLAVALLVLFLHPLGILPLSWQNTPLTQKGPIQGHAVGSWSTTAGIAPEGVQILENGQPLLHGFSSLAQIVEQGRGRYLITPKLAIYSASDNSNPMTNGRVYTLRQPAFLDGRLVAAGQAAAAVGLLLGLLLFRKPLCSGRRPLWIGWGVILVIFGFTRLPFITTYYLPEVITDSHGFLRAIDSIEHGSWPLFDSRTAGYPLFLALFFAVTHSIQFITALQIVVTLLAFLLLIFAVFRVAPRLTLPVALLMSAAALHPNAIRYELSILSDSLFAAVLVCVFAALLLAIKTRSTPWMAITSAAMGLAILIRPAGLFLVIIWLLLLGFVFWNRYSRRCQLALMAPILVLLLAASSYNRVTTGTFGLTFFGGANIAGATALYWEEDDSFSPELNDFVRTVQQRISPQVRATFTSTRDTKVVAQIINDHYNHWVWEVIIPTLNRHPLMAGVPPQQIWAVGDGYLQQVSRAAIRQHPDRYLKFVMAELHAFFSGWSQAPNLLQKVANAAAEIDEKAGKLKASKFKRVFDQEVAASLQKPQFVLLSQDISSAVLNRSMERYRIISGWNQQIVLRFSNLWTVAYFSVFAISVVLMVRRRFSDPDSFLLFLLCSSTFGAALLVALCEQALTRYSYPMVSAMLLSLGLAPLLWGRGGSGTPAEGRLHNGQNGHTISEKRG